MVDPGSNDPVAAIKDLTHGRYADLTLDTSSNPDARLNAIKSTKVWGTMCFVGEGGEVKIDVSPHLLRRQMTLVASWTFSNILQAECARFSVERKIDVDKLFTAPLEAGRGRRRLQAVRQAGRRQGRVPDVTGGAVLRFILRMTLPARKKGATGGSALIIEAGTSDRRPPRGHGVQLRPAQGICVEGQ